MSRVKAELIPSGCPNCGNNIRVIVFYGNHQGDEEKLEEHCPTCRWAIGGDGELRHPGLPTPRLDKESKS